MGRPKTIGAQIRWHEIHGHEFADKVKFDEYANVKKSAKNALKKANDEIIQQSKEAIAKADMALKEWHLT